MEQKHSSPSPSQPPAQLSNQQSKTSDYKQVISAYCPPSQTLRTSPKELLDSHAFKLTKSPMKPSLIQYSRDRQILLNKFLLSAAPPSKISTFSASLTEAIAPSFPPILEKVQPLISQIHHSPQQKQQQQQQHLNVKNIPSTNITQRKSSAPAIWQTLSTKSSSMTTNTEASLSESSTVFDAIVASTNTTTSKQKNRNTKYVKSNKQYCNKILPARNSFSTTNSPSASLSPIRNLQTQARASLVKSEEQHQNNLEQQQQQQQQLYFEQTRGTSDHFLETLNDFKQQKVKQQQQIPSLLLLSEYQSSKHDNENYNDKAFMSKHKRAITSAFESKFQLHWEGIQKQQQAQQQEQHAQQVTRFPQTSSETKRKSRKITTAITGIVVPSTIGFTKTSSDWNGSQPSSNINLTQNQSGVTSVEEIFTKGSSRNNSQSNNSASRYQECDYRDYLSQNADTHTRTHSHSFMLTDLNDIRHSSPQIQQSSSCYSSGSPSVTVLAASAPQQQHQMNSIFGNQVTDAYDFPVEFSPNYSIEDNNRRRIDFGIRVRSLTKSRQSQQQQQQQSPISQRGRVKTAVDGSADVASDQLGGYQPPGTAATIKKQQQDIPYENDGAAAAEWGERAAGQIRKFKQVDYLHTPTPVFRIFSEDLNQRIHKIYSQEKSAEQVARQMFKQRIAIGAADLDNLSNVSHTFDLHSSSEATRKQQQQES